MDNIVGASELFSEDLITEPEVRFLMQYSYEHLVLIMDALYEHRGEAMFSKPVVKPLWGRFVEIVNRVGWLTQITSHSAVVREKDFSKLLRCLFQFDIDGRFEDNEECFCRILDNWKEIRGVLMPKQPLAWAQMLDKKLGANELSCSDLSNINHYLVNMVFSEYQQICVLLENLDMSLVKAGRLRFCTKTGNVEFNGASCVLAEPGSVRFLVLRKIMSSKTGRVKKDKLTDAISNFLEKKSKTNEVIDANQRKSLYNARDDINKKISGFIFG